MVRLGRIFLAFFNLLAGVLAGWLLFEVILHANPTLLLRGVSLVDPIDSALTVSTYDVHYSDADVFMWRPDLIRSVPAEADYLEAQVTFETDEYGFRNHGPLPPQLDGVVFGRSISMAGHLNHPWPELLARQLDWAVLNLAQPGSNIELRLPALRRYGQPRQPRWVILEVIPAIDLRGSHTPAAPFYSPALFVPAVQSLVRQWQPVRSAPAGKAIYPLEIDLPGRKLGLTCCMNYLEFFSLDKQALEQSQDWLSYRSHLLQIQAAAREQGACVALLNVPTKPVVYFPETLRPEQLQPALLEAVPLQLAQSGWLEPNPTARLTPELVRQNAQSGRDLLQAFALQNGFLWIDPDDILRQSVLAGQDPFMVYDSHWNQWGHQLVAQVAAEALKGAVCP